MRREKIKKIKLVVFDVDGVLTDGSIIFGSRNDDYRRFNVQDGLGFLLLKKAGLKTAIITSKSSKAIVSRSKQLGVDCICKNVANKLNTFRQIIKRFGLKPAQASYMGDDLLDLGVLKAAGFSATVPEAPAEIRKAVDYITKRGGGKGAARELIELILKNQNKWQFLIKYFSLT